MLEGAGEGDARGEVREEGEGAAERREGESSWRIFPGLTRPGEAATPPIGLIFPGLTSEIALLD